MPGLPHIPPPTPSGHLSLQIYTMQAFADMSLLQRKILEEFAQNSAHARSLRATGSEGVLFGRLKQKINFRIFIFVRPVYLCCPKLDTFTMPSRLCPLICIDFVKCVLCSPSFQLCHERQPTSKSQFNQIKLSGHYMYHLL